MLPLTFRTKLLASYLALVAAAEVITLLVLNQSLAADLTRHLDERLEQQAWGAASWVSRRHEQHGERSEEWSTDRQAIRLSGVVHAWVTIFDEHGEVIGDSGRGDGVYGGDRVYGGDGDREGNAPEVLEARARRVGRATRFSENHREEMLFVAVLADRGEVVRLAVPLADVTATIHAMRDRLVAAFLFASVVAIALGFVAQRLVASPLLRMKHTAARMAAGDFDIDLPPMPPDEFGVLARSLASLASQLKARIGDLVRERDRLSAILSGMVEGVIVVDPDERVVIANPSAVQILGRGAPLIGRRLEEAVREPQLLEVLRGAETGKLEHLELAEGGGGRSLIVNVQPLAADAGSGAVAVIHDVTQLRRLEGIRKDFVANISHELRTPVAAIQGYAETLLRDGGVEENTRREFLDVIHRHARRIGRLVSDLLRLSEIEARGPEQMQRARVRIADIAANALDTARDRLAARSARLVIDVPPDLAALADADGLEQVLDNLVDNAIKYGRQGGEVRIAARRDGEAVVIAIEDDGPGIAREHLPRIFERFYRVDAGRSREVGGAGLGLAIVKRLLESMGGAIAVESDTGQGARFLLSLAVAPD